MIGLGLIIYLKMVGNTQIRTKRDEMDLVRAELREVIRELQETTQLLRG